ncbi:MULTISPECIES: nuclease-related domain-containing protein [Sporosarcina]|uniref:nuclease-related domain-containing protein n=1 Tax=Sporosarcina TaxID=1569 RepID=UPI0006945A09|nr:MULTISPECIES: nuclease-related domain-containing protein [Sporosarcina]WJY27043.1 nuclease-related domain-containing protein [Sporosarcina sp. 0.2-SM1T-5]
MIKPIERSGAATELRLLEQLRIRGVLPEDGLRRAARLSKGNAGEEMFGRLTAKLRGDVIVQHDLYLEHAQSAFQIDSLLILEKGILLFEVKNYEGDYVYEDGAFRLLTTGQEILNPLHQLSRSRTLLQGLMKTWKAGLPVTGYIVFVHPHFALYHAPTDSPIVLPGQLERFLARLDLAPSVLGRAHQELAGRLRALSRTDRPMPRLPAYTRDKCRKGIACPRCSAFMIRVGQRTLSCPGCTWGEPAEHGILRSVRELALLFPEDRITTARVHEWCAVFESPSIIRQTLKRNFTPCGGRKHRYYEVRDDS